MTKHGILGTLLTVAVTTAATADFVSVVAEDVSDTIGTPDGLTTLRFYATFTEPSDQLLAVGGESGGAALWFSTNTALVNDGGQISGLKQEDFAYFPISAAWDSWVTIDHDEFVGNDTNYSPGFLDNDGIHAVIVGSEWSDDNDGWFDSNPNATPALAGDDLRVLIAQFTIADPPDGGAEYQFRGMIYWHVDGGGVPQEDPFYLDTVCNPSYELDPTSPPADIDGDGAVGFADLLALLSAWGACQPAFELTGQSRMAHHSGYYCITNCGECSCWSYTITATGFGRFDRSIGAEASVTSVVRDDRLDLEGSVEAGCGGCCAEDSLAEVRLEFLVHVPVDFAFTASVLGAPGVAQIVLSGPGGFELSDPIDTSGVLTPGEYVLDAVADAAGGDNSGEGANLDYALDFAAGRCAADLDRDGVVGFSDLLLTLVAWGPSTGQGACCLPDGSCVQSDGGTACALEGGTYHGDEVPCELVICPQPGACCLPSGLCVQSSVGGSVCEAQGGVYHGDDTLCADVVCTQPGACCFDDFTCETLLESSCLNAGGSFVGEGTACNIDCTKAACCLPDGSCMFVELVVCDILAGDYQGNGIPCESITCP